MPTPIMKRDVIIKYSVTAGSVADLAVSLNATFNTSLTGTTIKYEDESSTTPEEKTKYKIAFAAADGTKVGCMTVKLVGNPQPATGGTVAKVRQAYDFDPPGVETDVALIDPATHSFERIWKQNVTDRTSTEVVDNIAKVDIRVKSSLGYTVNQRLDSAKDNSLVVLYSWVDGSGTAVVSGSVTFDSATTQVARGYTVGGIRITDNDSGAITRRR